MALSWVNEQPQNSNNPEGKEVVGMFQQIEPKMRFLMVPAGRQVVGPQLPNEVNQLEQEQEGHAVLMFGNQGELEQVAGHGQWEHGFCQVQSGGQVLTQM